MSQSVRCCTFLVPPLAIGLIVSLAAGDEMGLLRTMGSPNEGQGSAFGAAITGGIDFDADGYPDIIVAASSESPYPSPSGAGRVYVISGVDGSALVTLSSPNEQENGHFGVSVSGIEDVDGDGYPDVVVGASWEDPGLSPSYSGRAYVLSGKTGAAIHQLVSLNPEWAAHFGSSVGSTADVDGDGCPDAVVGAPGENPGSAPDEAGRAYLFSGVTGSPIMQLVSPNEQTGGRFGAAVAGIGDLDGDGHGDLVVGAPWKDTHVIDTGKAYVISGSTGTAIHELSCPNLWMEDLFGAAVASLGDIDGDGFQDVGVGAPVTDTGEKRDFAGRAYVFSGATGVLVHVLASPNPENEGHFGYSLAGVGDLDGDGCPDIVVGAYFEDPGIAPLDAGRAYVFSGAAGSLMYNLKSPSEEGRGHFGCAVAGVGDINGDGLNDIVVSAPHESPGLAPPYAGRVYVFTPGMLLWGELQAAELALTWTPIVPAAAYWVYGASNEAYFVPCITTPHQNRLAILSPGWSTWSIGNGIGDPDSNWTYLLVAVDNSGQELERSNRIAEFDFGTTIAGERSGR